MQQNSYIKINHDYTRTIVVGDIHGCLEEFTKLLRIIDFQPSDVCVCAGDFMNRGLNSWGVARLIRNTSNICSVVGNHEIRIAGTIKHRCHAHWSQKQTLGRLGKEQWLDWANYLDNLPSVIESKHAIISHGRLDPNLSLSNQDRGYAAAVGGKNVDIQVDEKGIPTWFYQRNWPKPLCIGHRTYDRVELVKDFLFALDTQAVTGGYLTAVILPEYRIVSVRTLCNYYKGSLALWELERFETPSEWDLTLKQAMDVARMADRSCDSIEVYHQIRKVRIIIDELNESIDVQKTKQQLVSIFGDIPDTDSGKKQLNQSIRSSYTSAQYTKLAYLILTDRYDGIESLYSIVRTTKLSKLIEFINEFLDRTESLFTCC
jgi:serine/threonine protein phosphatase 1